MKSYSEELKASLIARMLPPNNASIPELLRETAIPKDTLYGRRRSAQSGATRAQGTAREGLSSEERFNVVLETASLNELELGEYWEQRQFHASGEGKKRRLEWTELKLILEGQLRRFGEPPPASPGHEPCRNECHYSATLVAQRTAAFSAQLVLLDNLD